MNDEIVQINPNDVKSIEWTGDHIDYDIQLYRLGNDYGKFIAFNPWLKDDTLKAYIDDMPSTNKCVVWQYQGDWVAKLFNGYWTPEIGYEILEITKPKLLWNRNPDIDKVMTFENDPYGQFEPEPWDSIYQLVWYMDPRVNPTDDKIWVMSCKPYGKEVKGIKDMGYVMPLIDVEYNEDLPDLGIDINQCYPAYWDLGSECAWELDPIHIPYKQMWVVKFTAAYKKINSWKWYGTISPQYHIEYNPDLPKMDYVIDYVIPYHDLAYEHVWMLDNKHLKNGEDEIWAIKARVTPTIYDSKIVDYISPTHHVEYNSEVPKLNFTPDYIIPWHDLAYEHIWYMDDEYDTWALKVSTTEDSKGIKEMYVPIPEVVFISYQETNAEENWQRVLEKAPKAKRVNGVTGIFNAHQAAAKLVDTDMFFVVDGDAYLTDEFQFDHQPNIHDRDCTHIWRAKNPINGLVYGYGGVKLFSKQAMLSAKSWTTLDLSTTVIDKLKIIDTISNITAFDTDPISVWRSTFRECAKLCYNVLQNSKDKDSKARLKTWLKGNTSHRLNKYSKDAAQCAIDWVTINKDDYDLLRMINSREWIEEQYKLRNI